MRLRILRVAAIAVVALVATATLPALAGASTFRVHTVTDLAPDGDCLLNDCSIRDAVQAVLASTNGPDTILLPGSITLSLAGTGENNSVDGDLDFSNLDHDVMIRDGFNGTAAIRGGLGWIEPIISISGVGSPRVELSNFGISGDSVSQTGGCIVASEVRLSLAKMRVNGCRTTTSGGGGIRFLSSIAANTLEIRDSGLSFNTADGPLSAGGSVYMDAGRLTIERSSFRNDLATDFGGSIGLGESLLANRAVLRNVHLDHNSSETFGGAMAWLAGWSVTILNSTFVHNRADYDNSGDVGDSGGAFAGEEGSVANSVFSENFVGLGVDNACHPEMVTMSLVAERSGHNVFEDAGEYASCAGTGAGHPVSDIAASRAAIGLSLPTQYRASWYAPFEAASVLRGAGSTAVCGLEVGGTTADRDVRDGKRPETAFNPGQICDVGAYEEGGIAELGVTTQVDTPNLKVGESTTGTITLHNAGPDPIRYASLLTDIGTGLAYGTITPGPGLTCGADPAFPADCIVNSLASGATTTVQVVLNATAVASAPALTAFLYGVGLDVPETDNEAFTKLSVAAAAAPPTQQQPGGQTPGGQTPGGQTPTPNPPTGPTDDGKGPILKITPAKARIDAKGFVTLSIACPANEGTCTGSVVLQAPTAKKAGVKRPKISYVKLGVTKFSIVSGSSKQVKVKLTKAGLQRVRLTGSVLGRAVATAKDAFNRSRTTTVKVTYIARKK